MGRDTPQEFSSTRTLMIPSRPMHSITQRLLAFGLLLACTTSSFAQGSEEDIQKILREGKDQSRVMETLEYLSEEIGARLTGSSAKMEANVWTRNEFRRLGLKNVHLNKWGEIPVRFDRGPSHVKVLGSNPHPLQFTTRSWGAGTEGPVTAELRLLPTTADEMVRVLSDLEGKWILKPQQPRRRGRQSKETLDQEEARLEQEEILRLLGEIEVAGTLSPTFSKADLLLTSSIRGWRELTMETLPTDVEITITNADYNQLKERLEAEERIELEVDLDHAFTEGPFPVFNTVAEIPGSEKPEEVLIFSGHLDSWDGPGSTGTQDNGTGCAVMLEVARILMDSGVKPKRTIRFCLWGGEEQGLFGSTEYVAQLSEEERARISACFVDDGGGNYQGGLICIESMKPMLDLAIAPVQAAFPHLPMSNTVQEKMPKGGASDHSPFNRVGIPGFFWKESGSGGQEGRDYNYIHHTQHDTMRYVVPEYLVQSATCSAVVAFNLAQADSLLPRETAEAQKPKAEKPKAEVISASSAMSEGPLNGAWDGVILSMGSEFEMTFQTHADGSLTGRYKSGQSDSALFDGKWNAETGELSFLFDYPHSSDKLAVAAMLKDGKLEGAINENMEFEATRRKQAPAATSSGLLDGQWQGEILSMGSEFLLTFETHGDGSLTGRYKSSQSDSALFDGKWDPKTGSLSFLFDYPHSAEKLLVTGTLKEGKLTGEINGSMEYEAQRMGQH